MVQKYSWLIMINDDFSEQSNVYLKLHFTYVKSSLIIINHEKKLITTKSSTVSSYLIFLCYIRAPSSIHELENPGSFRLNIHVFDFYTNYFAREDTLHIDASSTHKIPKCHQ